MGAFVRRHFVVVAVTLVCLVLGGTATVAQPSPSASAAPTEQSGLTQDDAVALVLATDPRYTDLPDYERLRTEAAAKFDYGVIFGSDYVRVLGTLPARFSEEGMFMFHNPVSWLIEATLVRDCTERSGDTGPWPDPCEWRHSWFYRVQPDGTVSLMFDEGDTAAMPNGDG